MVTNGDGKMNNDMKCPVCNVGYVHESVNHWCCDYEFCPSYDETDTETYDILIRTRKVLDKAKWWLNEIVENHRYTPISTAEMALAEITALEKSELENLEMLVNNVFK